MPHSRSVPFRNREQTARVCRTLLARVGREQCWPPGGPSNEARLVPPNSSNSDERRLLEACWTLWESTTTLSLAQLLRLEPAHLEVLGELIAALARGPDAIDDWVERMGRGAA